MGLKHDIHTEKLIKNNTTLVTGMQKSYQKYQLTHIWFLTNENVYSLEVCSWSHIKISISLELNHVEP